MEYTIIESSILYDVIFFFSSNLRKERKRILYFDENNNFGFLSNPNNLGNLSLIQKTTYIVNIYSYE